MSRTARPVILGAAMLALTVAGCASHPTPAAAPTPTPVASSSTISSVSTTSAAVALAALPAPKTTAPVASKGPDSITLTFVAVDEPGNLTLEDLGTKDASDQGPDLGDLLAFTQTLQRNGKSVGQVHVVAVGVDHKRNLSQASATVSLADGTIEVAGLVPQSPTFTLAVVGGTGAYLGDRGAMVFDAGGASEKITLHLFGGRS